MAPKRLVEDELSKDEKQLLVIATRLDAGLRYRDKGKGEVIVERFKECIKEEMVRHESVPDSETP